VELMIDEGELKLDFEDEVLAGACITRDGEIVHEGAKKAAGVSDEPKRSGEAEDRDGDEAAGDEAEAGDDAEAEAGDDAEAEAGDEGDDQAEGEAESQDAGPETPRG